MTDNPTTIDAAIETPVENSLEYPMEASHEIVDDYVYLLNRTPLSSVLSFVKNRGHKGCQADLGVVTDEWRQAQHYFRTLEQSEAGCADNPPITPLPEHLEPLRAELMKDPLIVNGFNRVPTDIAMVELDRIVVSQRHIDLRHVQMLKETLGPAPSDEQIFRTCLPANHPRPPFKWSRVHANTYVFISPSNDLRFLGATPLETDDLIGPRPGLIGVLGLQVGFGSNFLNLIFAENRLILHNGSHRAYAMRDLGITHVPAIIQYTYSMDEVNEVAASSVAGKPYLYLREPRPPMLKDYFNPNLRKVVPVVRRNQQITVKLEVDSAYVPVL